MDFLPHSYNPGLVGKNYDSTSLMMVLHFSDTRAPIPHNEDGYRQALLASQTGRIISQTLDAAQMSLDDIFITNYVKEIRPNDKSPGKKEYDVSKPILINQIKEYEPKKIIFFGSQVNKHFFNDQNSFKKSIYTVKEYDSIPVLISEHPGYIHRLLTSIRNERIQSLVDFLK